MLALPNDPPRLKMKIRLIAGAGGEGKRALFEPVAEVAFNAPRLQLALPQVYLREATLHIRRLMVP